MMKQLKVVSVLIASLLLTNCAGSYKMKSEKGKVLNQVPKWYMNDFSEKKACDIPTFGKDKDKMCIFGVGTAVSPGASVGLLPGGVSVTGDSAAGGVPAVRAAAVSARAVPVDSSSTIAIGLSDVGNGSTNRLVASASTAGASRVSVP